MEIGEGCLNKWNGDWAIEDYLKLDKIIVKKNSLMNLKSLKICNCELLKSIEIKDGELQEGIGNGAFANVKKVKIESSFEMVM